MRDKRMKKKNKTKHNNEEKKKECNEMICQKIEEWKTKMQKNNGHSVLENSDKYKYPFKINFANSNSDESKTHVRFVLRFCYVFVDVATLFYIPFFFFFSFHLRFDSVLPFAFHLDVINKIMFLPFVTMPRAHSFKC